MRAIHSNGRGRRRRRALRLTLPLVAAVALTAALLPGAGSAQSQTAPKSTGEPSILGTPVEKNTLTATNGSWSGSPATFVYGWLRCPKDGGAPDGSNCGVIPDATKSAYLLHAADVGFRIRIRVTASNADGSASATSNATSIVTAAGNKPASTSPPTISGTPQVGQTLSGDKGSWSGNPTDFNYWWMRCDKIGNSCSNISGARAATYTLTSTDRGNTIRFKVGAQRAGGSRIFATSAQTAVIAGAAIPAPPATGCPAGSNPVQVTDVKGPARLLIDRQLTDPTVLHRGSQQLTLRYHISDTCGQAVKGAMVYATAVPFNQFSIQPEQPTGADGWVTLTMRRLSGFPAASKQGLLVIFVRARKPGDKPSYGITGQRLFSMHVNLNG
ncbi:MAG: hypothetical protein ACXVY8_07645 [Gaiellaceae bacterium]